MSLRRGFLPFILVFLSSLLFSQSPASSPGKTNFKSRVNVVIVNVVVTDRNGNPVPGLVRDDFRVSEEGRTQKVLSFEEHKGIPSTTTKLPPLPPHVFSNFPATRTTDDFRRHFIRLAQHSNGGSVLRVPTGGQIFEDHAIG